MCSGLTNKFELAKKWITNTDTDIFIMQEAELTKTTDLDYLKIVNYDLHYTKLAQRQD